MPQESKQSPVSRVSILSPFTHLAGHYWPYTMDAAIALASKGIGVEVHASLPPREAVLSSNPLISWRACCSWISLFCSVEQRNLNWGSRSDTLLRNLEFYLCLKSAMAEDESDVSTHIHCIESRHKILLREVIRSNRSFSSLCVGSPHAAMDIKQSSLYERAFATGRLKFIVETEAVRKDWEKLAGEHVVHIPAALSERVEQPLDKREARRRIGLPEEAFICLFFGTHREGKDYRTAIDAAKLAKSHPYLLFAGPLISGNDPEVLLKELQYDHAASWKRYYPDEGVSELFDAVDAVMLPYAKGYTKGSGVLLQACKYGKPVIASNTGHLADFVNLQKTGLLYEPGDPASMAEAYDQMESAEETLKSRLREGMGRTTREFSWDQLVHQYRDVLHLPGEPSTGVA